MQCGTLRLSALHTSFHYTTAAASIDIVLLQCFHQLALGTVLPPTYTLPCLCILQAITVYFSLFFLHCSCSASMCVLLQAGCRSSRGAFISPGAVLFLLFRDSTSVVFAYPADPMLFFAGSVQFSHAPLGGLFCFDEFLDLFEGVVFWR